MTAHDARIVGLIPGQRRSSKRMMPFGKNVTTEFAEARLATLKDGADKLQAQVRCLQDGLEIKCLQRFESSESLLQDGHSEPAGKALRALRESIGEPEGWNTSMLLLIRWTKSDAPNCSPPDDRLGGNGDSRTNCSQVQPAKRGGTDFANYIAGLTMGSNEQRENAPYAIGDLVDRTEESAIKPIVVLFTSPLIRVATQATTYSPSVKTAILSSMLKRIPNRVKHFFPQLQRTFVKSISDPSNIVVRTCAADVLGVLMRSQPRMDPVVTGLISSTGGSEEEIATSYILALSYAVRSASVHGGLVPKSG
ncbi:hypothetical protein BU15DRAFT_66075 [Melanogaster broomeanus]|nr:hypothetical protein BU15DRAFT_66075 [Melanogaster broomeanus]